VLARRGLTALRDGTERSQVAARPGNAVGRDQRPFPHRCPLPHTHNPDTPITATVNGKTISGTGGNHKTLLRWLREEGLLTGRRKAAPKASAALAPSSWTAWP
jgi:hypothetical protein